MVLHKESTTIPSLLFFLKKKAGHCVMNNFCEIIKSSIEGKFHKIEIEYPNWIFILENMSNATDTNYFTIFLQTADIALVFFK